MRNRLYIATLALLLQPLWLRAQELRQTQIARQAIYYELGGNALALFSVNYERALYDPWKVRIGYGNMIIPELNRFHTIVAMGQYSIPISESNVALEFGLGSVFVVTDKSPHSFRISKVITTEGPKITALIGSRWQAPDGGFMSRVGVAPLYGDDGLSFTVGLSFGFAW